jgi:hypothetical protein
MRGRRTAVRTLVLAHALALLAPRLARAQEGDLAGTFRVASDQTTVQVPEWGSDCGPRPASHTGPSGRQITVTTEGSQLVIQDGRRRQRTDGCWSDNPRVRRTAASGSSGRWTVQCQTPAEDYQREQGTYVITATPTRITMRDTTEYAWQLRGSNCRATATRVVTYERVGEVPTQTTTPVDAGATTATTRPQPTNRCAAPGPATRLEIAPARRALAPGGRTCFRVRLLDANGCEASAPPGSAVAWQLARSSGTPGSADATLENGCVRAPAGSPVAEYAVTASAGGLTAHAVAAVVSAEELRSLIAQHIEDEGPADAGLLLGGAASGAGVGAVVVRAPATPTERGGAGLVVWLLVGCGLLLATGGVSLLLRRRDAAPRSSRPPGDDVDAANASMRPRREAVPIPARELPVAKPAPPSLREAPAPAAAAPAPRPLVKRCPTCDTRFTAEMAFCPEHGTALVDVAAGTPATPVATAPVAAVPAAICPACGRPVEGGARFCPHDGTPVGADATPLVCPKCGKRYALGTAFCGEDGVSLSRG